jgi:hypothetical protein
MKLMREDNKKTERSALRRAAAPVAVALILLLAGCAGAGGGGDASPNSSDVTDEDPVTNTSETTENTTEEDNTEQVEGDFADKFSTEDEELREEIDGYDLTMAHERALVDTYESFTVDGEVDWDGQFYWDEGHSIWGAEDANGFVHYERVSDAPGEQVWSYFQSVGADESKRIKTDNGTRTLDDRTAIDNTAVGGEDVIATDLSSANYEFNGYTDDNGTTVAVFEATEATDDLSDDRLEGSADSVEGEMWISEPGVIRKSELTAYSGDEVVYESEFRVTNINSTETQPPSWAEDYAEEHGYYN